MGKQIKKKEKSWQCLVLNSAYIYEAIIKWNKILIDSLINSWSYTVESEKISTLTITVQYKIMHLQILKLKSTFN